MHRTRILHLALAAFAAFVTNTQSAAAQSGSAPTPSGPTVTFDGRGITIRGTDSVTSVNLRFRLQEMAALTSRDDGPLTLRRSQLFVRRARIRLEAIVHDPRLKVNLQLAFSRLDLDQDNSGFANVLRDALVTWQWTPRFSTAFGQTKLPGLRETMTTSNELVFADRSILHALFVVERDVGVFANYARDFGKMRVSLRSSVTSGEGRNPTTGDGGLAYSSRLDVMPLGAFANNGDFSEGGINPQPQPRISFGAAVSRNDGAIRTGGQSGPALYAQRDLTTAFGDVLFKSGHFSLATEYAHRSSGAPITTSGTSSRFIFAGEGVMTQASYLIARAHLEPAVRVAFERPALPIRPLSAASPIAEASAGITRYVVGHKVKWQLEIIHDSFRDYVTRLSRGEWTGRGSIEVGI
ncbi:MAG: porin [Gemmatimonadaceae bacterium]